MKPIFKRLLSGVLSTTMTVSTIWDVFCYNSATKTVTAINSIR